MNMSNDTQKTVQDNKVVSLEYSLKVDGEIVDQTEENDPVQFIQGQGQVIPGLERQLYGMAVGESKKIDVSPEEGYGQMDEEAYADVPRSEFPPEIPLEPGVSLQLRDEEGEVLDAYIAEVKDDSVRLNFNHPLAGKALQFLVTVVDLRDATSEELEHGHVHAEDEWDDEEWDEDEEDDELWDEDEEFEEGEEWDEEDLESLDELEEQEDIDELDDDNR